MNGLQMQIELRPCLVHCKSGYKRALFHCWSMKCGAVTLSGDVSAGPVGIVELEDGRVGVVSPEIIRFTDDKFADYSWVEKGENDAR